MAFVFALFFASEASAATVCPIFSGCTGTGTAPAYGQLLIGGKNGEYEFVASSTFGGGGGGGGSSFSTTSAAYWFTQQTTSGLAEGANLYFTGARALATALAGYVSGAGTISSTDSILSAIEKLNGNIAALTTGVSSVFGRTGAVTAQTGDYTTSQVTEGLNLYYTLSRWASALAGTTTDALKEGTTNLYFTNARAVSALTGQNISIFANNSGFITGNQTITLSGDISGSGATAITTAIGANKVSLPDIAQVAAHSLLVNNTGSTGNVVAIATSSLGLTTSAFASANISQWTNNAGYLTSLSGAASSTLLTDSNMFSGTNTFSNTITGGVTGNAGTATKLATARAINNVNFDGSAAITITAASSTGLSDSNTFSGVDKFTNSSSDFGGTWQTFSPSHFQTALGFTPVPNTRNVNTTYPLQGGGAISSDLTLTTAFSTTTANAFNALNTFTNATSTQLSAGTLWLTGITGSTQCLHVDNNGKITGTGSDCGTGSGGVTNLVATYPLLTSGSTGSITISTALATTTIQQTYGAPQLGQITLATSSALSFNGLTLGQTIGNSSGTFTFTPTFTGTLNNSGLANSTIGITANTPLTGGGTPALGGSTSIGCQTASGSQAGCLSSADWTTFNNKGSVTSVSGSNGITGTVTTSGSLSLDQTFGAVWTAASSTYTGHLALNTASSSLLTTGTLWLIGPAASSILATDANGMVIATSSIGANSITGVLPIAHGGTGASGLSDTGIPYVSGGKLQTANIALSFDGSSLNAAAPIFTGNINGASETLSSTLGVTGKTTLGQASSTLLSVFKTAYFGGTSTTTIDSSGNIVIASGASLTDTGVSNGCATWASAVLTSTGVACGSGTGTGIGTVATSALETEGQVAIWGTSSGYPAKLYSVATSTPTVTSPITYSGTLGSFVGGTSGTFACATCIVSNAGDWAGTWQTLSPSHFQTAGTYLTSLGNYATTTGTAISLSTTTTAFNGLTFGQTIAASASGVLFTPSISGTLSNTGLAHSTIVLNGTTLTLGDSADTITAASSTLLSDSNTFSGADTFNNTITGAITGNAGTATKLATARAINNVNFDGTAAITITAASSTLLGDSNTYSGHNLFTASTTMQAQLNLQNASSSVFSATTICLTGDTCRTTWPTGGSGTVTSIVAGTGLTGGTITTTGTIALDQSLAAIWTAASSTYLGHLSLNTASSTQFSSPTIWDSTVGNALWLGDSTGKATAYTGTTCTNQFPRSLNGAGVATCSTVQLADLAADTIGATSPNSTLSFGSAATLGNTFTADLNLNTSNQWTASTTFTKIVNEANASTSLQTLGTLWNTGITSAVAVYDANHKETAGTTQTCTNQFVRAMSATYSATCASVAIGSDVSGLGTGIVTWLGTPSSANLISALTDETGSGSAVFSAGPAFTGTPTFAGFISTASTTIGGGTQTTGLTILGNSTTTATSTVAGLQVSASPVVATSTEYIYSKTSGDGGSIIIEDVGGAACTQITTKAGVISGTVVTCPTEI